MRKIYFNKIIAMDVIGLKCDAEGCDYRDSTIHKRDYKLYLNAPCPECGASLLTEKDLHSLRILFLTEKLIGWIRLPSFKPSRITKGSMNGSGHVWLKEVK